MSTGLYFRSETALHSIERFLSFSIMIADRKHLGAFKLILRITKAFCVVAQSVERATPGEEVLDSITAVAPLFTGCVGISIM